MVAGEKRSADEERALIVGRIVVALMKGRDDIARLSLVSMPIVQLEDIELSADALALLCKRIARMRRRELTGKRTGDLA